jgi:hypothetical protein
MQLRQIGGMNAELLKAEQQTANKHRTTSCCKGKTAEIIKVSMIWLWAVRLKQ